jgi:hypothetical protein
MTGVFIETSSSGEIEVNRRMKGYLSTLEFHIKRIGVHSLAIPQETTFAISEWGVR